MFNFTIRNFELLYFVVLFSSVCIIVKKTEAAKTLE
jgi:hypothetical protein